MRRPAHAFATSIGTSFIRHIIYRNEADALRSNDHLGVGCAVSAADSAGLPFMHTEQPLDDVVCFGPHLREHVS